MPNDKSLSGVLIMLLCLMAAGCPPPGRRIEPVSPETLLQQVRRETARLKDFKGSAQVTAFLNGRHVQIAARIQYRQPDRLRIDIRGPFFQTLAIFSIQDRQVQLYAPSRNIVFEGMLDDPSVTVPGLSLPLTDFHMATVGLVDLAPYNRGSLIEYQAQSSGVSLAVRDSTDGVIRRLWIDPDRAVVTRQETISGEASAVWTFEQYTKFKGIWRPSRIRLTRPNREDTFELAYDTQSTNTGLTGADLSIPLPASARRMPLQEAMDWLD